MSIVLIGKIGSGKTSLFNKITKSFESVKSGGDSVTMSVFMKQSCEGAGFKVLDTPGFGSDSKKIDHVAGVLSAISQGPLNRIMIVTKFDRTNSIFEEVKKHLSAFVKYTVMITVVITCWDQCDQKDQEKNKKDIKERLGKIRINSVLFFGLNDSPKTVCEQIDQIIQTSQAQNVVLQDKDIYGNFDLQEFDEGEIFEIEIMKADLVEEYFEYYLAAIKLIDATTCPKNQLPNFLYALNQFSKQMAEKILNQFELKQQKRIDTLSEINKLKAFQIHNELRTSIFAEYDNLVQKGQQKLNTPSHFSKFIKKCNYCNQVWLKVAGCDGGTVCGKLVDGAQESIDQPAPPLDFEVTYIKKKLEVKEKQTPKSEINKSKIEENLKRTEQNEKLIEIVQGVGEKVKVGGIGCKKIIYWNKMLDLTEDEMNEVRGVLDINMQKYLQEKDEEVQKKTMAQQALYQKELVQKIQEQRQAIKILS